MTKQPVIGFIGQGWIGKHYADDFERRGFTVVRYAAEMPYSANKEKIKECDIVFIAVPTPTTPAGFDDSIVRSVVPLVGKGKIAVIKSTLLPGTTESIQKNVPDRIVLHSPEFLSVATAAHDASNPTRNIVGIPIDTSEHRRAADAVLEVLPKAPYSKICSSRDAEIIKYGRNCLGYTRVIFINIFYDLVQKLGADWEAVREAMAADPDNGPTYMNPVHKNGRGAGGACYIKDFEAFIKLYGGLVDDPQGKKVLESLKEKNLDLLVGTNKDLDLLRGVYGDETVDSHAKNR